MSQGDKALWETEVPQTLRDLCTKSLDHKLTCSKLQQRYSRLKSTRDIWGGTTLTKLKVMG